jgi:protein involved in temperature-dependent protein secretion
MDGYTALKHTTWVLQLIGQQNHRERDDRRQTDIRQEMPCFNNAKGGAASVRWRWLINLEHRLHTTCCVITNGTQRLCMWMPGLIDSENTKGHSP